MEHKNWEFSTLKETGNVMKIRPKKGETRKKKQRERKGDVNRDYDEN